MIANKKSAKHLTLWRIMKHENRRHNIYTEFFHCSSRFATDQVECQTVRATWIEILSQNGT